MSVSWQKAIRDFWRERTRSFLAILAIALGLAGFTAVMASYAILTRELNAGYLATNPASATLRTDVVDDALLAAVKRAPGVRDAEARRTIGGKLRGGNGRWRGLTLFVVQDFGDVRIGKLLPQHGAWPPAAGEILIERDALQVAKSGIGDRVRVRTTSGVESVLRISGTVHDVGQAQARMENLVYGYVTAATLAQLGERPELDQLLIEVTGDATDAAHIRNIAAGVKSLMERSGHPVRRVDVPPPGKHPHAELMGLLLLVMSTFGLFVLFLSGILVVNLLTAMMAAQVRQIGVMKAIGGSRWQIGRIYLGQALLLGIAAIAIAVPLGLWGSRLLCRFLAVFLNFDLASFAVPAWVYLLVLAVGLITPLLSAAWPVWIGTAVPVREALDDFGVSASAFGTSWLDRRLAGMGGAARPIVFAIRNSFRRRTRLVLTLLTLAIAGVFFMSALNLRASMVGTLDRLFASGRFDRSAPPSATVRAGQAPGAPSPTGSRRAELRYSIDQHLLMIYVFLIVMACVIGAVGGLGLMTTMSLNVLERRREMGVLRAIGATPAAIALMVMIEGCAIATLGWALAVLGSLPVSRALGNLITGALFRGRLDFHVEISGLVIWLAASLLLAAIASFLPAWQASRGSVREALGYE
jgi:putative ABC transport system permease protein